MPPGCCGDRFAALTEEQRTKFPPLCPDFVIELRSPTDSLPALQSKMQEYIDNGARLGWLIDPRERRVHVYRPGSPVELLQQPRSVSADPLLPGFTLEMADIWLAPRGDRCTSTAGSASGPESVSFRDA